MEARHYCRTCDTHFRLDPDEHLRIEHDGGLAQIVGDGNWRDFE